MNRQTTTTTKRGSGTAWLAVVAGSALALVIVLAVAFVGAIDDATQAAFDVLLRDARVQAGILETQLRSPGNLTQWAGDECFTWDGTSVVVDEELGALEPAAPFDPATGFDALAQERLRRASLEPDPQRALAELRPLADDPATPSSARAWLLVHMAWLAHRGGLADAREALLTEYERAATAREAPETQLAAILLRLARDGGGRLPNHELRAAIELVPRVPPALAHAFVARLAECGVWTDALRIRISKAERRRALLRTVTENSALFRDARDSQVQPLAGQLLLFWPKTSSGALLERDTFEQAFSWLWSRSEVRLVDATSTDLGAVGVANGFAALAPSLLDAPSPFIGPLGAILIAVALAVLCGVGSLFAARALRRERETLRLRTEFLATVTHELKTPLAGVRLVAELLADGHVKDEHERATWLRRLEGEAARLGMLIRNVLGLGRSERAEAHHAPERTELVALCD